MSVRLSLAAALLLALPCSSEAVLLRGSASPFTPASIGSLLLWLDQTSGIYSDAGVTPAIAGGTVQQWNDRSGNGNNVSQATGGNRPTFTASGINSQTAVSFNGSTAFMTGSSFFPTNHPYTIVAVAKTGGTAANTVFGGSTGEHIQFSSTSFLRQNSGGDNVVSKTSIGTGVPFAVTDMESCRTIAVGSLRISENLYVNGNYTEGVTAAQNNGGCNTDATVQIGAYNSGNLFNGVIDEILVYNKLLTVDNTNNLNSYLNGRYALGLPHFTSKNLVFDGDSIVAGNGASAGNDFVSLIGANEGTTVYTVGLGAGAAEMVALAPDAAATVDPLYSSAVKSIVTILAGTNDLNSSVSVATTYAAFQSYCAARHAVGWKVVVVPMFPRTGLETQRLQLNADFASDACADAKVSDTCSLGGFNMWAPGANTNATYYTGDQIHPNDTGYAQIAPCVQAAIDSL